jgi:hypothetical protein
MASAPYLLFIHSIIRYLILLFGVIVVVQSLMGMMGNKKFMPGNRKIALFLLIFCDLQLVFGLVLYYFKLIATGSLQVPGIMKDTARRFWAVEHSLSMVIAIVLVHVGYSFIKKNVDDIRKFKRLFWCSFIALVLFMAMTPWEAKQVVGRPYMPAWPSGVADTVKADSTRAK